MFDEAEFTRLATKDRGLLCSIAINHLNRRFLADLDDVLQSAFAYTWEHRAAIHTSTGGFLRIIVMRTAMDWHEKERRHEVLTGDPVSPVSPEPNAEMALIKAQQESHSAFDEWQSVKAKLPARQKRHLEEWEQRGYTNHNHSQSCRTNRARLLISGIVGRRLKNARIASVAPQVDRRAAAR